MSRERDLRVLVIARVAGIVWHVGVTVGVMMLLS